MTDDPRVRSRAAGAAARPGAPGRADADRGWLREAIELSTRCSPSRSAFSVGAVLVSAAGRIIATGHSRERDPADHAEEAALAKVAAAHQLTADQLTADQLAGVRDLLAGATLYSSLEPCLRRASRPRPCAELIVAAGIRRVVVAWLEPPMFVPGGGAAWLRGAGVTVIELPELAAQARAVNAHLVDHRAAEGGAG
jgi:diaminohydroxyphosphoribosylaminopyrimidine deaminase/5-amino-6-(5-phosphoribosylamino)uracil reductase